MKLLVLFVIVVCERCADGTRVRECVGNDESQMLKCGNNPYCPYPDTTLYRRNVITGDLCCCKDSETVYVRKVTLITAECEMGQETNEPRQECYDYPYCEDNEKFFRMAYTCCCYKSHTFPGYDNAFVRFNNSFDDTFIGPLLDGTSGSGPVRLVNVTTGATNGTTSSPIGGLLNAILGIVPKTINAVARILG